jgi:hypothetical protein
MSGTDKSARIFLLDYIYEVGFVSYDILTQEQTCVRFVTILVIVSDGY